MSQNIEENRRNWPREYSNYNVGGKNVSNKKIWEPPSDYETGGRYPNVKATTFRSGHSFEVDTTPGGERIRLIHPNGSYVEMQHDGTTIMRSEGDAFEVVAGSKNVRVKGECNVFVDGGANIKVSGNADFEIGGDATGTVGGTWKMTASEIKFDTSLFSVTGDRMEHNGINVGDNHKHQNVMPGGGISGVPLP